MGLHLPLYMVGTVGIISDKYFITSRGYELFIKVIRIDKNIFYGYSMR
ncbi:hypothetical protein HMPREF0620_0150 [Parascardovia denticolens DSM 10105 = JCM 12538]|uniref:Uncharacterized protein n=1 Tax=Parascardovia denticolens DSM 10105 = JCM 12538 TaxID=864564 RepID=E6JZD0_PARDN|nr:hypothetical protein HMPREF0620_0150 [Parascardovia denticolens DSM 10105 = JCM 12538]